MLLSEFVKLSGFEPTAEEYTEIEERYYNFNGDKEKFCEEFSKKGFSEALNRRKEKIELLKSSLLEQERRFRTETEKYAEEIKRLQYELDKELEWKPCLGGTNITQERYEELENCGRVLTDEEAKNIIYNEFGFTPAKISIVQTVSTYESDKHNRIRVAQTYERKAVYVATDYNYIRFNCAGWSYEMVNGELLHYSC